MTTQTTISEQAADLAAATGDGLTFECILGAAGTGKSTLLRERAADDPNYAKVTASTGIAAVNLGPGVTTVNSALGFYNEESAFEALERGRLASRFAELANQGYKNLVIDEVSMMSAGTLTAIALGCAQGAERVQQLNGRSNKALVPTNLILTGDFCFGEGTPIMMADGTIKPVEQIQDDDLVMGTDSTARKVLRLTEGEDDLYLVEQTNADRYVVNSGHLIVLKRGVNGSNTNEGWRRFPQHDNAVEITAPDLMERSCKFRKCFVGYKAGVVRFVPQDTPELSPYFLGLWLGDGDSDAPRITTPDQEVIDFCKWYAESYNLGLTVEPKRRGAWRIAISSQSKSGGRRRNKVWNMMQDLGVVRSKHIPSCYLFDTEEKRLEILAGLLDTDGCWSGNRYTITGVNKRLMHEVKQLADQLGFRSSIKALTHGYYANGSNGGAWVVSIGGDTWRIPCRVERKMSVERRLGRDRLSSVLTVKHIGKGKYYGFQLKGDDPLFLLGDGTVAHNCQLSPINAPFAFTSPVWSRFEPNIVRLDKVYRQTNPLFLEALQAARAGSGTTAVMKLSACGVQFVGERNDFFDGISLVPTNDMANKINATRYAEIAGAGQLYKSTRWGKESGEWKDIPEQLELKAGVLVMILANEPRTFGYVNGDTGVVLEMGEASVTVEIRRGQQTHVKEIPYVWRETTQRDEPEGAAGYNGVTIDNHVFMIPRDIEQAHKEKLAAIEDNSLGMEAELKEMQNKVRARWFARFFEFYDAYVADAIKCRVPFYSVDKQKWVIGWIEYLPIRLAYASTVHKAQGLTLDTVQIDARSRFAGNPGSMYVALSRCRTPENIRVVCSVSDFARRIQTAKECLRWV